LGLEKFIKIIDIDINTGGRERRPLVKVLEEEYNCTICAEKVAQNDGKAKVSVIAGKC
jgi:hypothetical protein